MGGAGRGGTVGGIGSGGTVRGAGRGGAGRRGTMGGAGKRGTVGGAVRGGALLQSDLCLLQLIVTSALNFLANSRLSATMSVARLYNTCAHQWCGQQCLQQGYTTHVHISGVGNNVCSKAIQHMCTSVVWATMSVARLYNTCAHQWCGQQCL